MSLGPMSVAFLCHPEQPDDQPSVQPDDQETSRAMLLAVHAELNCRPRRGTRPTKPMADRDDSGPSEDELEFQEEEAKYAAVDAITGHVLVGDEWKPYVVCRWADPETRDKRSLDRSVKALINKAIKPEFNKLERAPVNAIHAIVPLHVVPELNDGTEEGRHQHLIYRLKGKKTIGKTTLELVHKGYASKPEELQNLEAFVSAELKKIAKAGKNQNRLRELMGFTVRHNDLMPIRARYTFKHFDFGQTPFAVDTKLELELAQFLESKRIEASSLEVNTAKVLDPKLESDILQHLVDMHSGFESEISSQAAAKKAELVIPSPVDSPLSDDTTAVKRRKVTWDV